MDPFVGEIRLFAGSYIPENWIACNGQALNISEYQALFALIGTTYGGDGTSVFKVPNLQIALEVGQSGTTVPPGLANAYALGQTGGAYQVALTQSNLPAHNHTANASASLATTVTPGPTVTFATAPAGYTAYVAGGAPTPVALAPSAISAMGGGQPHNNMMPSLVINYIMSATGIYPSFP